jgi:CDP-diacylglycerol--serine O-phosphatidyltransferase
MKRKRKTRTKEGARKGIYILPNLFTSANLFAGFYAIVAAIHGNHQVAAVAIILSGLFDALDGRIARITRTASAFGNEYDSLADIISFGVAPATLAYLWALEPFGRLGWLAAFMFLICGALRLARFNVQKNRLPAKYFNGLPIPAAGCFISCLVLFTSALGIAESSENKPFIILLIIYFLSFLMVSTIQYPSFKEFNLRDRKPFNMLVSIVLIAIVIIYKPRIMLFFIAVTYLLSGPAIVLHRLSVKRSQRKDSEKAEGDELRNLDVTDHGSLRPP